MVYEVTFWCTSLLAVILIVGLSLLLVTRWFRSWDTGFDWNRRSTRISIAIIVAMILLVASVYAVFNILPVPRTEFVYEAIVTTEGSSGAVILPLSDIEELQEAVAVVKGDGRASVVDTEHGRALRLEFSGNVTARGVYTMGEYLRAPDFTTTNGTHFRDVWMWFGGLTSGSDPVSVMVRIKQLAHPGHDAERHVEGTLSEGWHTYEGWLEQE
jgi:hypothetical protein